MQQTTLKMIFYAIRVKKILNPQYRLVKDGFSGELGQRPPLSAALSHGKTKFRLS
jgi:hypothetical protein